MINWEKICKRIMYWDTSIGNYYDYAESNPIETVEVASANGSLCDIDNMVYIKELIGFPISYDLYCHIDRHYDGSVMELSEKDIPAIEWLIEDYVTNGKIDYDIWKDYDFENYQDEYGFCGWHKRVLGRDE